MTDPDCPFCYQNIRERIVAEKGSMAAIPDGFPVTEGHCLIIPRRHTPDYFSLTRRELADADELLRVLKDRVTGGDPSVTGFNVGVNCGLDAGQTILHAHIHLIPRRAGDTPHPRGGVRGVIPEKMSY